MLRRQLVTLRPRYHGPLPLIMVVPQSLAIQLLRLVGAEDAQQQLYPAQFLHSPMELITRLQLGQLTPAEIPLLQ